MTQTTSITSQDGSAVPGPQEIRQLRANAGLTQLEAAKLCNLGAQSRWAEYENGTRKPSWATWQMFMLLTNQHPSLQVTWRRPS